MLAVPRSSLVCLLLVAVLVLVMVGCSGHAEYGRGPRETPESQKVVLCHKGKKTLQVGAAAAKAHYDHGDTAGPCN